MCSSEIQFCQVIDFSSEGISEIYSERKLANAETVIQTSGDNRIGSTKIYKVIAVKDSIVVDISILGITVIVLL
jgi:hypothetical protein